MPNAIEDLVTKFTSDLSALIRSEALASITSALGGAAPAAPAEVAPASAPAKAPTKKATAKKAAKPAKKAGKPGTGKRDPAELAKFVETVGEYIKAHPGEGAETLKVALKCESKDLQLPIRKLLAEKRVIVKGQKRASRYFPKG